MKPQETSEPAASTRQRHLALKAAMMPRDTNQYGTIFGGVLLSYIDLAGGIGSQWACQVSNWPSQAMVTIAMDRVEFKEPVFVGDTVSFWTRVVRVGRTSMTIHISVEAERKGQIVQVTEAEATYVAIRMDDDRRTPIPLRS